MSLKVIVSIDAQGHCRECCLDRELTNACPEEKTSDAHGCCCDLEFVIIFKDQTDFEKCQVLVSCYTPL